MLYREFLLFLLAPVLAIVATLFVRRYRSASGPDRDDLRRGLLVTAALVVVAVVYTMPWDRWLIVNDVWSYPPGSVLGTVADVPVEEYLFMIGQTVLTGLWTLTVTARMPDAPTEAGQSWRRPAHAAAWLAAAVAGGLLAAVDERATYLGALLLWFGLPLALQAATGADVLRAGRARRLAGLAITVPLWLGDIVAIGAGAWRVSPAHTTGLGALGLPLEEAVFFLTTNLLIVNSLVLVSAPAVLARLRATQRSTVEE